MVTTDSRVVVEATCSIPFPTVSYSSRLALIPKHGPYEQLASGLTTRFSVVRNGAESEQAEGDDVCDGDGIIGRMSGGDCELVADNRE